MGFRNNLLTISPQIFCHFLVYLKQLILTMTSANDEKNEQRKRTNRSARKS